MKIKAILSVMLSALLFSFSANADQVLFYHTDPAGTPLSMTNSSGVRVWQADYKPFGEEYSIAGSAANNKRFVGKEKDTETGLSYFGARYEDAKTGRFVAVDPVGAVNSKNSITNEEMLYNPQKLNKYAYALNNPYRNVDPDGKEAVTIVMAFFANLFFGGTANAPEYKYTPTVSSQTAAEFAGGVALAETGGLIVGRALGAAFSRTGLTLTEQAGMIQYTTHAAARAAERGFTPERIARVLLEGKRVEGPGRYGPQYRYTLGENTVVVAKEGANANKVVTTFNPNTTNGVKGHWTEP